MSPAHLLKVGLASLALLAVPAGIDTRALIVDGTGTAMGTATNPIVTSGSGTAPAAITDATANPTTGTVQNFPMVWNGTTWDRWKDMAAANAQTSFVGVPAVAPFYLDTTGTPSVRRGVTAASTTSGITGIQVPGSGNLVWDATSFRPQLSDTSGRTVTVGASAAGAVVAGNPLLMGGSDGANSQFLKVDTSGRPNVVGAVANTGSNTGINPVLVGGSSGSGVYNFRLNISPNDNASNAAEQLVTEANQYDFNGTGWDRHRNSQDTSLHASAVTGTGTVNTDVTTYNYAYLVIHANVTLYNAGTVLFKVQMQDANGIFADIPLATTGAVAAGADIFLTVGPTAWGANATPVFYANQVLPRTIRIVQTVAAASVTFSAAYCLKN